MLRKYIAMLFIIAHFSMQGSAFQGLRQLGPAVRSFYSRGLNQLGTIRSAVQGSKPNRMTSNINAFKRPISNIASFAPKSNWARPAVMTGLVAGAGLGTGYCLTRSPVFAQEANPLDSLGYELPKSMIDRIHNLVTGLKACDDNDYLCASALVNEFDDLIQVIIWNNFHYDGEPFKVSNEQLRQDLLPYLLDLRKQAAQKTIENSRYSIFRDWKDKGYTKDFMIEMLSGIGIYSGAVFKHDLYPDMTKEWVEIPLLYQGIINAIARDPQLKHTALNDLEDSKQNVEQRYKDSAAKKALLDIISAVQAKIK